MKKPVYRIVRREDDQTLATCCVLQTLLRMQREIGWLDDEVRIERKDK